MQYYFNVNKMANITAEMDTLQNLVLGEGKTPISSAQVRDILQQPTTPELVILVLAALEKKVIDKNLVLIQSINSSRIEDDLVLVGLALRYGADPNQYVNSELGIIHILAYTYAKISNKADRQTLNLLTGMLLASGSSYISKAFDANKKGDFVKDNSQLFIQNIGGETVIDWIGNQGYSTILPELSSGPVDKTDLLERNPDFMSKVGLYLNRLDLVPTGETNELMKLDPKLMIKAHSTLLFEEYLKNIKTETAANSSLLRASVIHYNLTTYKSVLNKGIKPDYTFVNDLITRMAVIKKKKFYVGYTQLDSMLTTSVKNGTRIDTKQLSYLRSIDTGSSKRLEESYARPYWKKNCEDMAVTKSADVDLRILALSLNAPTALTSDPKSTQEEICNYIGNFSRQNPETLKAAAVRRQEIRVSAASAGATDFLESTSLNSTSGNGVFGDELTAKLPIRICRNRSVLASDPYGFNDAQLAFYTDKVNVPWCFTSDMFKQLISTGDNPINQEQLPESFILELKNKDRLLDALGIRSVDTLTFAEAVDKLSQNDTISDVFTNKEIEKFLMAAKINGVNGDKFRSMTNAQLQKILQIYGRTVNLLPLSQDHAFSTFSIIANNIMDNNPRISNLLFSVRETTI